MTPEEILHEIVKADHEAREVYNEAVARQESYSEYIEERRQALKREYYEKADAEISRFDASETARADASILELDREHEFLLSSARNRFETGREAVSRKIFGIVVGKDA